MKVAYILNSPNAAPYKLGTMILPQLEAGDHGAQVAGMFFFDDNTFVLRRGDPVGEWLSKLAQAQSILLVRRAARGSGTPWRGCRWGVFPTSTPPSRRTRRTS